MILVKAVRILLGTTISEDDIRMAEKLIKKFCKLTEEYYGQQSSDNNYNCYIYVLELVIINTPLCILLCLQDYGVVG